MSSSPVVPIINVAGPDDHDEDISHLPSISLAASPHYSDKDHEQTLSYPPRGEHLTPLGSPDVHGKSLTPSLLRVPSLGSATTSYDYSSEGPHTPGADSDAGSMNADMMTSLTFNPSPSPSPSFLATHNTTKLRDNNPNATQGVTSLQMLDNKSGHSRKLSFTSNDASVEGTEPDHGPVTPTAAPYEDPSSSRTQAQPENSDKKSSHSNSEWPNSLLPDSDYTPFAFPPSDLASSLDPKNLEQLNRWGGTTAILAGLGTHANFGLRIAASTRPTEESGERQSRFTPSEKPLNSIGRTTGWSVALSGDDSGSQPPGEGDHDDEDRDDDSIQKSRYAASLDDRRRAYGINNLPDRKSKSLLQLMWSALQDRVLILLIIAAAVSLALGLYQDFGTPPEHVACPDGSMNCTAPAVDWVEGVAILIAVIIVVVVGSVNDWQKERQFKVLNAKKEDRTVTVIRNGVESMINVKDVVVGDICLLEPGEIAPVDGIFIRGHNIRCDESGATGESDAMKKATIEECWTEHLALEEARERGEKVGDVKKDPFIISGSKVMEGVGAYVVIAVGERSFHGRIMMGLREDTPSTPLQLKLNNLAELIAKLGSLAGLLLFTALMIRFFVELKTNPGRTASQKALNFVQILIIAVTIIVVAVPEGLPLAVTLALAFATKRMTRNNLLVRVLGSCETMANATVICTDKTGTLTQNVMHVVAGCIGVHGKFVRDLDENDARSPLNKDSAEKASRKFPGDFAFDMRSTNDVLSPALRNALNAAVAINSTAFEDNDPDSGDLVFVGSKTETALLRYAKELGWIDYRSEREHAQVVQLIPFSSERKAMGVVVKITPKPSLGAPFYRFYVKGASEVLTKNCGHYVAVQEEGSTEEWDLETEPLSANDRENISRTIIFYANQMLRTIAICYRDFASWPPVQNTAEDDDVPYSYLTNDMTLLAVVGIEDPLRPGVREAVAQCQKAGVAVKMCTGDNVLTARSIATQCGIYTPGGIIMEGPVFRKLNDYELMEIVPRLQVLARSSPEDKKILVSKLKARGDIVGVTGDGSNDSLALKEAHVGFSMGIAGTEVAKEASDIILMDDNFSNIVSAIMWGRCVNDAVKKFLQFQVSVNITAVVITFVTAVASSSETSVLTAVQLLWINIIMDTFAALALATDPAKPSLLNRKPDRTGAPLFSVNMVKMILGQAIYQIVVILILKFLGDSIFNYENADQYIHTQNETQLGTLIFNAFVFCQIFNSINCRKLDNNLNVFEDIFSNKFFLAITGIEVGAQILIVFIGGQAFQVHHLTGYNWLISIIIGALSIPLGLVIRVIPNEPCERLFVFLHLLPPSDRLPVSRETEQEVWNSAIERVRDNLSVWNHIRGGRVRASSFVGQSRQTQLNDAGIQLSNLMTMVPTLVATTIGAGWMPTAARREQLADPASSDPSQSSAALFAGQITMHPDTDRNDPFYQKFAAPTWSGA